MIRIAAAGRLRPARRGLRARRRVRLDRVLERQRRRRLHGAAARGAARPARAEGREALRGRPGHGRAARALRPEGRPDAGRVPRRSASCERMLEAGDVAGPQGAAAARRHRPRGASPTNCASSGAEVTEVVAYRTVVAEPEREGEPDIYRMLLERRIDVVTFTSAVGGPQLRRGARRRAGRRPAAHDGRRVDRPGHGRSGRAVRHRRRRSCRRTTRSRRWSTRSSSTSRRPSQLSAETTTEDAP